MNIITLNMTRKQLENNCVELMTVNGRPFSILDDSGFQNIVNPIKYAVEEKNKHKFSISSESIQKRIFEEADRIRKEISDDITNILISLKIAVTRLDRSFLGVNIQYIKGTKIILRTLALKELQEKHTGEYIKTILKNVCFSFNISLDQIYSITTDNGANMLKAVRILTYEDEDCDNDILEENNIDCNSEENEANEYEMDTLSVFENINVLEDLTSNNETSTLSLISKNFLINNYITFNFHY
ncbi:hypothetical protein ALC57_15136 [Trachymyrmex cornetzi]|uniref:Zinc finger BED domain-containing protein 4 n=1 Tax=Trachymyrmex cornetzi TaxID=471704 RepID=A0A151IXH7_9HYME|nr:hypothetical protein ALC57_15136 [Trachymyrmex cornetzi]